jgi:hypothetical protein
MAQFETLQGSHVLLTRSLKPVNEFLPQFHENLIDVGIFSCSRSSENKQVFWLAGA